MADTTKHGWEKDDSTADAYRNTSDSAQKPQLPDLPQVKSANMPVFISTLLNKASAKTHSSQSWLFCGVEKIDLYV